MIGFDVADERDLLKEAMRGTPEGLSWWKKLCSQGESEALSPPLRQLVEQLRGYCRQLLIPESNNFTSSQRTPWGGYEILCQLKGQRRQGPQKMTPEVVGESWELSGMSSHPSCFTVEGVGKIPITMLQALDAEALYGKMGAQMPFLVKFLNSGSWQPGRASLALLLKEVDQVPLPAAWTEGLGISRLTRLLDVDNGALHKSLMTLRRLLALSSSPKELRGIGERLRAIHDEMLQKNLSLQVHPRRVDSGSLPPKSEAWAILDAEPGAGIYLGLAEGVTRESLRESVAQGGDLTSLLNFVPVRRGDTFFIPSGMPHAIGAGVLLLEPQEPSEVTFRLYDWGRLVDGQPRALHVEEALSAMDFTGLRGRALTEQLRCSPKIVHGGGNGMAAIERLVDDIAFCFDRLTMREVGDECSYQEADAPQGFTVVEGSVKVFAAGREPRTVHKGQSFMAPAALPSFTLAGRENGTVVMRVAAPNG